MKRRIAGFVVFACVLAGITACYSSTSGQRIDAGKIGMVEPNVTTTQQLLEWFGSPQSKSLDAGGGTVMTWMYIETNARGLKADVKQQILSVLVDKDGVVQKVSVVDQVTQPPDSPSAETSN